MKALITGASSGIGRDMATYLGTLGWELILVGRNKERLNEESQRINTKTKVIAIDLSKAGAPQTLYSMCKNMDIDMLINNAGFGLFGEFEKTNLDAELEMINLNIKTVHILSKLFFQDFKKRNSGYILNVASSAAYMPGPLLSTYYATKAYVLRLTNAISQELKESKSKVSVSVLCPGPVDTDFNNRAGVVFSIKPISSEFVAKYAIDKALAGKHVIIPTTKMKICCALAPIIPNSIMTPIVYRIQKKKMKNT